MNTRLMLKAICLTVCCAVGTQHLSAQETSPLAAELGEHKESILRLAITLTKEATLKIKSSKTNVDQAESRVLQEASSTVKDSWSLILGIEDLYHLRETMKCSDDRSKVSERLQVRLRQVLPQLQGSRDSLLQLAKSVGSTDVMLQLINAMSSIKTSIELLDKIQSGLSKPNPPLNSDPTATVS